MEGPTQRTSSIRLLGVLHEAKGRPGMSKPIATVVPQRDGYAVQVGESFIKVSPYRSIAEDTAAIINNAVCTDVQIERDYLLSTCKLVQNYFRLLNDPQGASAELIALARHETEGAVNVAIAMADGKDVP